MKYRNHLLVIFTCIITVSYAQKQSPELVYQDQSGVIRWTKDKSEVALFGANYCLPSACDYRGAGYVSKDRKKMVDEDMAHFARMGWDALRLSFWGDFENTDSAGNLLNNVHLNLMDYVIAKAAERNIYILLSPIVTYSSQWPDALQDTTSARGFSTYFKKEELGTNRKAIAAQQNYLKQLLNHVNPYTNVAIKNEPNILFIEMINEPWHHSDDVEGSIHYINALIDAVRNTGCNKILFHNISQDFNMATALQKSNIQGASFAWYPTGLVSGHTLTGNYLPVVDDYSLMLKPELSKLSRIVYEFDSPDLLTGYMYPAMARTFRAAGAQFATMFSYDMLETAPYNLGWQTHFLNMVYTPVKAVSAIIAGEVMKNIPRMKSYGKYPSNKAFGPFKINYEENLGEMVTEEKFLYANNTTTIPPHPDKLKKIVGYGSSPLVNYEGSGIYFLDKIKDGTWRLEVYPDAVLVDDPFKVPSPGKVVARTISRSSSMNIQLPDLQKTFTIKPINSGNLYTTQSNNGKFSIMPGVYILSTDKYFKTASLPANIGNVFMNEFISPADKVMPPQVVLNYRSACYANNPIIISADIYAAKDPESVTLFFKNTSSNGMKAVTMKKQSGYMYSAEIPAGKLQEGWLEYCIVVNDGKEVINFPSGINKSPSDWDYYGGETWKSSIVKETITPLRLLSASEDIDKLSFTRIGDGIRFGVFKLVPSSATGEAAFHLELPLSYDKTLDDYTLSLPIKEKITSRKDDISYAKTLELNVRGLNQQQQAYITLVESDGTSWSKKIALTPEWNTVKISLADLEISKGVMLPLGYPGRWDYWFTPAANRGSKSDKLNAANIERIQLSVRPSEERNKAPEINSWIEITSAVVSF